MRSFAPFAVLSLLPFPLAAQDAPATAPASTPPQTAALQVPAAGSPEATALFLKACNRMLAVGSGSFRTDEEQDSAMLRGHDIPGGGHEPPSIRGGWSGDLLWAETDDDAFATRNGISVSKTDAGWKLRARTLGSGAQRPFLLAPALLFTQLLKLDAAQQQVAHVEAGEAGGKPVAILALSFTGRTADDLALGGALPAAGAAFIFGGMPGGMAPEKSYTVDLALSVEPQSGDVLRLRAKVYEDNPMLANMRIRFGGGGDSDNDSDDAPAAKAPAAATATTAAPAFKKGLPERTPGKTESVSYLKADFKDLGSAKPPSIDAQGQSWLGIK